MLTIGTNDLRILRLIIQDNEVFYARYVMKIIRKAMAHDQDTIQVFETEDGSVKGILTRNTYRSAIQECVEVFVRYEEFEFAHEAMQVKDAVEVFMLLTEAVTTPHT